MTQEQEDFEENFYLGGTRLVFGADGEGVGFEGEQRYQFACCMS